MIQNNSMIKWFDSQTLHAEATNLMKSVSSVLDIGCGIRPQQYIVPSFLICVEPHLEYVEILKKNLKDANAIIIPLDAKTVLSALPSRSIDSIFLIDVIEHMPKEVGAEVIKECERVARNQIILFTPLGFMPQEIHESGIDGWNLNGGELQDHKSGWYPEDFPGWNIVACKHLHFQDYKGQSITPPYGGFYAIKNITKNANLFNDLYSRDTIESATKNLIWIEELYPHFIDRVVFRDIEISVLKCALNSCQRTTQILIDISDSKTRDQQLELVDHVRLKELQQEALAHRDRINLFAAQFLSVNVRESGLVEREAAMNVRESGLVEREAAIIVKERQLLNLEMNIQDLERENENLLSLKYESKFHAILNWLKK